MEELEQFINRWEDFKRNGSTSLNLTEVKIIDKHHFNIFKIGFCKTCEPAITKGFNKVMQYYDAQRVNK